MISVNTVHLMESVKGSTDSIVDSDHWKVFLSSQELLSSRESKHLKNRITMYIQTKTGPPSVSTHLTSQFK